MVTPSPFAPLDMDYQAAREHNIKAIASWILACEIHPDELRQAIVARAKMSKLIIGIDPLSLSALSRVCRSWSRHRVLKAIWEARYL
jgi:hypothetical protein